MQPVINKGEDLEPTTGIPVKVQDFPFEVVDYKAELIDLLNSLDEKYLEYNMIEECLMMGAYRGPARDIGRELIANLMYTASDENFPVFDLSEGLAVPLSEPIFVKPFREKDIFDIIFGRTKLFLSIDINQLIERFTYFGVKARWLTRKETVRQEEASRLKSFFLFNSQAIEIELNNITMTLGDAFITRIVFDNLSPTYIVGMFASTLHEVNAMAEREDE